MPLRHRHLGHYARRTCSSFTLSRRFRRKSPETTCRPVVIFTYRLCLQGLYIKTRPHSTRAPCISKLLQDPRHPSRYPSPSRPWPHQLVLSTATTPKTCLPQDKVPLAPIHRGQPASLSSTEARQVPSSAMPISLATTATTSTRRPSSRKHQLHLDSLPWLRPFPSCLRCTQRSQRSNSGDAAVAASRVVPRNP